MLHSKVFHFLLFFYLFGAISPVAIAKPLPAIELMLQKTEILDDKTSITLTLHANAALRDVSLSLALPLGLSVIQGETTWEGDLKAGKRKALKVVIEAGTGFMRVVEGRASVRFLNGASLVKTRQLDLNEKEKPSRPTPMWQQREDGGVLEFRGP